MLKKVLIAFVISIIVPIFTTGIYGFFLNHMFSYESATHQITQSILLGIIFTIIICTMLILDKLDRKTEAQQQEKEHKGGCCNAQKCE